jgi:hypothetical protein
LESFVDYEDEGERKNFLSQNFMTIPALKVYLYFTQQELKEEKKLLQDLLLVQLQGK